MSQHDFDKNEKDFSLGIDEFRWKGKVWKDLELIEPDVNTVYHPQYGFVSVRKQKGMNVYLTLWYDNDGEDVIVTIDELRTERVGHLMEAIKHTESVFPSNGVDNPDARMARVHIHMLISSEPNSGMFCVNSEE